MSQPLRDALRVQHAEHRSWSHQLHYDNLLALAKANRDLGEVPSYSTVLRYMKAAGLLRERRRRKRRETEGSRQAAERFERRETRSYERAYVGGLWHLDFHEGSRPVLTERGEWVKPWLFGCLDDRSRLACHLQWYYAESAETLVHGLVQALLKRGLPGALMTDRGGAERAGEVEAGLVALSIAHELTLAESPHPRELCLLATRGALLHPEAAARLALESLQERLDALDAAGHTFSPGPLPRGHRPSEPPSARTSAASSLNASREASLRGGTLFANVGRAGSTPQASRETSLRGGTLFANCEQDPLRQRRGSRTTLEVRVNPDAAVD